MKFNKDGTILCRNTVVVLAVLLIVLILSVQISDLSFVDTVEGQQTNNEPKTIYVDDDATDGGDGSVEKPYTRIQSAIDNSSSGDTIRVFNGTYLENVIVNKTLSVVGNGSSDTVINGSDTGNVVTVSANWTNLSGFLIIAGGNGYWDAGISLEANNCTVSRTNSSNNNHGFLLRSVRDNELSNNSCTDNTRDGILISNSDFNTLRDNICFRNRYGIALDNADSSQVEKNGCTENDRGISVSNSEGNTISENTLTSNQDGLYLSGSTDQDISSNIFTQNINGIRLSGANLNSIHDNEFTSNTNGLSLSGSSFNEIEQNTVKQNEIGIRLDSSPENNITENTITENDLGITAVGGSSDNLIRDNDIMSNEYFGANASDNDGSTLDARDNWWGDKTGPYHGDNNQEGKGDNVTDNVLFDPWVGKQKMIYNPRLDESYVSIQKGIDAASDGDTLLVYEGTFPERITVDRSLTLVGNGSAETTIDGGSTGDVITITAPLVNITGFRISGSGDGRAGIMIYSDGCRLVGNLLTINHHGIFVDRSGGHTIANNSLEDNFNGIILSSSEDCIIENSTIESNNLLGIGLYSSNTNHIQHNTFDENNQSGGIYLSNSNGNTLNYNDFSENAGWAIHTLDSKGNFLKDNYFSDNSGGIMLEQSKQTVVSWNELLRTTSIAIYLMGSDANELSNNTCTESRENGILVGEGSNNNVITNNICQSGLGTGISLHIADNNALTDNDCIDNLLDGYRITRSDDIILNTGMSVRNRNGLYVYDCVHLSTSELTSSQNEVTGINLSFVFDSLIRFSEIGQGNGIGLLLNHSTGIDILNNTLRDNTIGIMFQDASKAQVHGNNIQDNDDYGVEASANGLWVNVTSNYWGHDSGPYHPANNSGGQGNDVTDLVEFYPWFGSYRIWTIIERLFPVEVLDSEPVLFSGKGISHFSSIDRHVWTSSIDGEFYNGSETSILISDLSNGTHIIYLTARDDENVWSVPAISGVHVNGRPRVRLDSLPSWVLEGDDVVLRGDVTEDSAIVRYTWISSKEGLLYNGSNPQFTWRGLSKGDRILSFRVLDDRGIWSEWVQKDFSVFSMIVASIDSITPQDPTHDIAITFNGSGNGDNPIVRYIWRSDVDGEFYNGTQAEFSYSGLSNGTHNISFSVLDSFGVWSREDKTILVINGRPRAVIESVTPNPAVPGEAVLFVGNGTDDGQISQYAWNSDLDGDLKSDRTFSTHYLSYGIHNITLRVKDDQGAWSDSANITLFVIIKPQAFIKSIDPSPAHISDIIMLWGDGTPQGSITAYRWSSSIDGYIYTSTDPVINISDLTPGVHTLYLEVQDDFGTWSDPVSNSLEVTDNLPPTIRIDSPVQDITVNGTVTISGFTSDDAHVSRVEYQLQGASEWKAISGNRESWTLFWDSTKVSNGTHTLVFRSFDGILHSDQVTLTLNIENEPQDTDIGGGDDDEEIPEMMLLLVSFGLILMIMAIIGSFYFKSPKKPEPATGKKDEKSSTSSKETETRRKLPENLEDVPMAKSIDGPQVEDLDLPPQQPQQPQQP